MTALTVATAGTVAPPTRVRRRRSPSAVVVVVLSLLSLLSMASSPRSSTAASAPRTAGAERPPAGAARRTIVASVPASGERAVIVLVGEAGESVALAEVLTELLQRQRIGVRFVRQPRLGPEELLASPSSDRAVWTFVEVPDPREAALYFRGPEARRFLLRRLDLPAGLDEVGRELIGQVAASAVTSLLRSAEGLTREQMESALARERERTEARAQERAREAERARERERQRAHTRDRQAERLAEAASPGTALAPPPPAGVTTVTGGPRPPSDTAHWSAQAGARYSASWQGPDLGPAHGPGLELGVERRQARAFRIRLSADRWFTQFVPTTNVDASVQTWPLRLSLDLIQPLGRVQRVWVSAGGGVDLSRITPGMVYDPAVTALAPSWHTGLVARAELGYELALGASALHLVAALFADASLDATHFDVARGDTTERAATPWRARPGGMLALVFRSGPTGW